MTITGAKAQVFISSFDNENILDTGTTTENTKYFVIEKGSNSKIPTQAGTIFVSPKSGTQITLVPKDKLFIIDEERFCKTSANFSFSQGSIDISTDCQPGATIPDGIITVTGSLSGLFKYDDVSNEFSDVTNIIVNKFLDVVEDDGNGVYELHPRDESQVYLLTLLNSNAKAGQTENWLFCPINLTSMSVALGNKEAQSHELSFSLGEGVPMIYKLQK